MRIRNLNSFWSNLRDHGERREHVRWGVGYGLQCQYWANRDWVFFGGIFGGFWARVQNLHNKVSNFYFLSAFSDFLAWNHIVSHRYRQHWVFGIIFTLLRALLKSCLCATQLYIRSDTSFWKGKARLRKISIDKNLN